MCSLLSSQPANSALFSIWPTVLGTRSLAELALFVQSGVVVVVRGLQTCRRGLVTRCVPPALKRAEEGRDSGGRKRPHVADRSAGRFKRVETKACRHVLAVYRWLVFRLLPVSSCMSPPRPLTLHPLPRITAVELEPRRCWRRSRSTIHDKAFVESIRRKRSFLPTSRFPA